MLIVFSYWLFISCITCDFILSLYCISFTGRVFFYSFIVSSFIIYCVLCMRVCVSVCMGFCLIQIKIWFDLKVNSWPMSGKWQSNAALSRYQRMRSVSAADECHSNPDELSFVSVELYDDIQLSSSSTHVVRSWAADVYSLQRYNEHIPLMSIVSVWLGVNTVTFGDTDDIKTVGRNNMEQRKTQPCRTSQDTAGSYNFWPAKLTTVFVRSVMKGWILNSFKYILNYKCQKL